jgi:hypothetical protein
MNAGDVFTIAFPPRYVETPVTVILVGKSRLLVKLSNGSQIWVRDSELRRRGNTVRAA